MELDLYLPVTEPTEVGQARRAISDFSRRLGFNETEAGKVAIVATELGTNLIKHAGGGELFARALADGAAPGIELLAVDHGPGISDAAGSLRDGFSTSGTPGTGLGAISRLSTFFDIFSLPERGTVVLAVLGNREGRSGPRSFDIGGVSVPMRGEPVCGDAWFAQQEQHSARFILADGLGHGASAAEAAREGVEAFAASSKGSPAELMQVVHAALQKTRGAAVAIATIDLERQLVVYAGLGNIASTIFRPGGRRNLVSYNGTAGHEARKIQEFSYPWERDAVLVMHSDGLSSRWDLEQYPGLPARRAGLIAGQIYSDHTRRTDDVTVLAARQNQL